MKIGRIEDHNQTEVTMPGATRTRMRMLVGPEEGAANFHMRHFEVAAGGYTPFHQHDYEHEIVILKGRGVAKSVQGDRSFSAGDVIYVPPNELHQFVNVGDTPCEFICLIPAPQDCSIASPSVESMAGSARRS